jgi:tetratricopeptide (TPR) repeat protein
VTVWWERFHQGTQGAVFSIGPVERVLIASRALWFYAGKLVWPADLTFSYPRWTISASDASAYVWLLATAALGVMIWFGRRRLGRGVEVAAVFFAATLSPMLGFIMLWTFLFSFVADHYQYLACLGPLALAAAGMEWGFGWAARRTPLLKPICCAVLLAILGVLTWVQCGQYASSETLWRATLARNPDSWLAHNDLGVNLAAQERNDEAAGQFKMAVDLNPDYAEPHNNLAHLLSQKGESEEAIAQFRKALDLRPNYAEAHNGLGLALIQRGGVLEAIAEYRQALDLRPNFPEAHNNLGLALLQQGAILEAIAEYRKALDLRPNFLEAHNNLGNALTDHGELVEAIAHYRKALDLRPNLPEVHNNLGIALSRKGEAGEAIAQFRKALDLRPDWALARENLGRALLRKGDFDGAMACFEKTAVLPSDPAQSWHNLARQFFKEGHLTEAIACCRRALSISPRFADAWAELGAVCFNNGQIQEAEESWQKALDINPAQPQIQNQLASLLATASDASLRNGPRAVALAGQAMELTGGGNPIILGTLAAAYAEAGRYDEAVATARKALTDAQAQKDDKLAGALQEQLKLYQAGVPMRQTR